MAATNKKGRSVAADTGQGTKHDEILSQNGASVNLANWLKDFRAAHPKLQGTKIVETVRVLFPGFDKTLFSKASSPEKYGVCLTPEVVRLLEEAFEGEIKDGSA